MRPILSSWLIEFVVDFSLSIRYRLLFIHILFTISCFSQENKSSLNTYVAEKIYLQLSSSVYATDQNIWFKAIVIDSENHMTNRLSGLLYVDLIDCNQQIIQRKLVKLDEGIGKGSFELQEDYVQGRYLIRAYTEWNLNFGEDFIFKSYINLYDVEKGKNKNPFESLAVKEKSTGQFFLTGKLRPQMIGKKTERRIQVYMDWDKGQDTISFKKKATGSYPFEYELSEKTDWINISFENGDKPRHTETIVLNDSLLDLRFFPESGQLVHGLRNKIGFKAIGFDGKGRRVQGEIFDATGKTVTSFKSNHLGMGSFSMDADGTTIYNAKISLLQDSGSTFTYPLPKVVSKGSILSVDSTEDKIRIRVVSNHLTDSVSVKASCRGTDYYLIEGLIRDGSLVFELPSDGLPEGIIAFTLMDSTNTPLAERLYFNRSKKNRLDIVLDTDKTEYFRREKTKVEIKISVDSAIPPSVDMSVIVLHREQWKQAGENILSYFLLHSELRGEVEEPGFYFRDENFHRSNDLDALLLTQGWRNYKYPEKRQGGSFFLPQPGLTLSGTILPMKSNNIPLEGIDITLTTFGKERFYYSQQSDSIGFFNFLLEDSYGPPIRILLSAEKGSINKMKYNLLLDSLRIPKVQYNQKPAIKKLGAVEKAVLSAKERRDETRIIFDSLYGVLQLDEVVVKDFRLKPEREDSYKEYGKPDVVIKGDDIRKKEKKWSYGLYSILLYNYADQVEIERFSDGFVLAHIRAGGEPTLLMVDGKLLLKEQYELVPNMPPGIVEDIELIRYAKSFKKQFLKAFPDADPLDAPSVGHIISVYTKGGVGIQGTNKQLPGTLMTTLDVFSPIKEFYTPKYDNLNNSDSKKPDLRSLLHWVSSISANENGNAAVTFYNGDIAGDYIIIVEAISKDGRIGSKEKLYTVGE